MLDIKEAVYDLYDLMDSEGGYYEAIEVMSDYIKKLTTHEQFNGNLVISVVKQTWQGTSSESDLATHETLEELWEAVIDSYESSRFGYDNLRMILEDKKLRFEFVHHDGTHRLYVRKEGH